MDLPNYINNYGLKLQEQLDMFKIVQFGLCGSRDYINNSDGDYNQYNLLYIQNCIKKLKSLYHKNYNFLLFFNLA